MEEALEQLLTVEDVMRVLRISRPTLYRMLKSHKLQPVKIGKRTLFEMKDIRGLIERSKAGGEQAAVSKKETASTRKNASPTTQKQPAKKERSALMRPRPPAKRAERVTQAKVDAAHKKEDKKESQVKDEDRQARPRRARRKASDSDKQGGLF
jgi:excisionase family DNA binding protein